MMAYLLWIRHIVVKHRQRVLQAIFGIFLLTSTVGSASRADAQKETREIMDGVFDAIAYLLPLSVREASVSSEWDRELIDSKLAVLRNSSAALVAHTADRTPEFRFLARSFDETVREIDASFREEWPTYAFFSLMELTQHCVACHSQQPSKARTEFSQRLLSRVNIDTLDATELAQLYVATRQFDAAMSIMEHKLLAKDQDAIDLDSAGLPINYLAIALGVAEAPERADHLLQQFQARPDAPYYLQQRVAHWRERLAVLQPQLVAAPDLKTARELFDGATASLRGGRDRMAAVDDLVITSILRRFIALQKKASGPAVAEAYYLLGVISLRTLEPRYSVPELEVLFASAIKANPGGPFAKPAYLILEEFGYVRGVQLARAGKPSKLIDMTELRHLIEPQGAAAKHGVQPVLPTALDGGH